MNKCPEIAEDPYVNPVRVWPDRKAESMRESSDDTCERSLHSSSNRGV